MEYILTEAEYNTLSEKAELAIDTKELQELCTLAAIHIPVKQKDWMGNESYKPWGCTIIDDIDDVNYNEYCDECPAIRLCPYTWKSYSQ